MGDFRYEYDGFNAEFEAHMTCPGTRRVDDQTQATCGVVSAVGGPTR